MNIAYVFAFVFIYHVVSLPIKYTHSQENSKKPVIDGTNLLSIYKENPKQLVSVLSELDPEAVHEILILLHDLLTTSEETEHDLHDKLNNSKIELGEAESAYDLGLRKLDNLTNQVTHAESEVATLLGHKEQAKADLDIAQLELDTQLPSLDSEQETLNQVMDLLWPFAITQCGSHDECTETEFCNAGGFCTDCNECHYNTFSIDAQCPNKCPVLCEDTPPQYPKCPICENQEECDKLAGLEEEEEPKPWPHCEDGSGRCAISDECKAAVFEYQKNLEDWFMALIMSGRTDIPPLFSSGEWPAAGEKYCECISIQAHCVKDHECYAEQPDEESEDDFTMHEFCIDGMQCTVDQCGWVERFGNEFLKINGVAFH